MNLRPGATLTNKEDAIDVGSYPFDEVASDLGSSATAPAKPK